MGGDSCESITAMIIHAGVEFSLIEPADLAQPMREIADRLRRGCAAASA
jgi:hypothetical protein